MKSLFFISVSLLTAFSVSGQIVTDTLKNVDVRAAQSGKEDPKRVHSPGMQRLDIDSAALARNGQQQLSTLLPQELPVFVKSYGFNSLATLQLRGASAAQTLVLWEGVPLANAALGIADLSTIPVFGLSQAEIVYGSSAALFGSGNVGGALRIRTSGLREADGAEGAVFLGAGSFSQLTAGARGAWTKGHLHTAVTFSGQQAQNNFTFRDYSGAERRMPNNKSRFGNAIAAVRYDVGRKDWVTAQLWAGESYRELPPAIFEQTSEASLRAGSLRTLLHWQHAGAVSWFAKAAALREDLLYRNPLINTEHENRSAVLFGEAGLSAANRQGGQLLLSGSAQDSRLLTEPTQTQNRLSFTASGVQSMMRQRLRLAIAFRGERVGKNAFLLPGMNASYRVLPSTLIRMNVQKTYRVPTLNELYYSPGGNPELKPEKGWHADAGWTISAARNSWEFRQEASGYYRNIHDWVAWFGGAIWTPHNIATVRSTGVETENTLAYRHDSNSKWGLRVHAAYCSSVTTQSYAPNDGSIGSQVPYAPRFLAGATLFLEFRTFYAAYAQNYTGERFITTDESAAVPAYATGRLSLEHSRRLGGSRLIFRAACNNIWNIRYEMIAGRPAPGRYGEISLEWRRN